MEKTAEIFLVENLEVFNIYSSYNRRNKHKMDPIPVCEIPNELELTYYRTTNRKIEYPLCFFY